MSHKYSFSIRILYFYIACRINHLSIFIFLYFSQNRHKLLINKHNQSIFIFLYFYTQRMQKRYREHKKSPPRNTPADLVDVT